jgi:hypothetical protein
MKLLVADSLGAEGVALAGRVLPFLEPDFLQVQTTFGIALPNWTVVIAPLSGNNDGTGGAYHYGCADTTLYVDADYGDDGNTTAALVVAEGVEVAQAAGGQGWDCGASGGEGLSRTLAEAAHAGVLDGYETSSAWLDGARSNWIDAIDPTDRSADSTGCSVLFLYWLNAVKGYTWAQIAQADGTTLAATYAALSGLGSAWADFLADVEAKWPAGQASGVTVDNPW